MRKRKIITTLAAVGFFAALLTGPAIASPITEELKVQESTSEPIIIPRAARLSVNVSCAPGGDFGWNVTLMDGGYKKKYVLYQTGYDFYYSRGGSSSFATVKLGNIVTGTQGIGVSSTYYGKAGLTAKKVSISVKVGSLTATGSDTC
jgi:hypothetical protein